MCDLSNSDISNDVECMTLSDCDIFNNTNHRAASLQQLSFLLGYMRQIVTKSLFYVFLPTPSLV